MVFFAYSFLIPWMLHVTAGAPICKRLKSPGINSVMLHRLAESIPWNRFLGPLPFTNSASGNIAHPHGLKRDMNTKTFLETKYFPS
jgi:hypothetical protein